METIDFILTKGKKVKLPPPSVDAYYKIYFFAENSEKIIGLSEWLASGSEDARGDILLSDITRAEIVLSEWLRKLRQLPPYKVPHAPGDKDESPYKTDYHELKAVSDYTGMNFRELRELDLLTFWRYYKDAIIYKLKKTEAGQEYLRRAWNTEQTKPDREAIAQIIAAQR